MFDDQPSYLGGLTTQLQDSMNGIQYGRSDVNEKGQYVPNDAASGRVYREMHTKTSQPQPRPEPQRPSPKDSAAIVYATINKHIKSLRERSKPMDFFGLTMPSALVETTPKLEDWIASAEALEMALQNNVPLIEQVKMPELSVARLALEFIQPDTVRMSSISQIERVQQLLAHLRDQAQANNIEVQPVNNTPKFSIILSDITRQASKGANRPRTKVGPFSVPQDFMKAFPNLTPQTIQASLQSLMQQIQSGEELVVDPKILGVTIPILFYTTGKYTNNPQELMQMAMSYSANSNIPNANGIVSNVQNNAVNPNALQNNFVNPNTNNQQQEDNFFSSTGGKIAMAAVGATVLYSIFNRD